MANHAAAAAGHEKSSAGGLFVAAIGVVFGDIGTSPLYAMKETFAGPHPLALDRPHILGVLSLVFWSIMLVVSLKYVIVMMRADNRGEGGSLALLALLGGAARERPAILGLVGTLGIFAAALFYGDSMITPAISVLSAVEGLQVAAPRLEPFVVPLTLAILFFLFSIQRHGSAAMGALFGPVMILWFIVLAVLGIRNIAAGPGVLAALSPHHAILFLWNDGLTGFLALGSVVLAVTGAEALYTDMGHFGRVPIRLAWYLVVLPSLVLNYLGQGALLLTDPQALESPFFHLAPSWAAWPMVGLATAATVIASQAVISGAFSVTRQAIQLGYLPRLTIKHTSAREMGQIYLPFLNWMLAIAVLALVLGFRSSSNLASAYGVAVTGTMLIDTVLISLVMFLLWRWRSRLTYVLIGLFAMVDLAFFLANATKIPHGGWFPLAIGLAVFTLLTTWKRGRGLVVAQLASHSLPLEDLDRILSDRIVRVPGTAVFLTAQTEGMPAALLHNLKHNKVLHERVVLLTVRVREIPYVREETRIEASRLREDIHRVVLSYGFMEDPNVPRALANATQAQLGFFYEPMTISYFLSRETILSSSRPGMSEWRESLFAWMSRSAASVGEFFHLPTNRVVELGAQVEI